MAYLVFVLVAALLDAFGLVLDIDYGEAEDVDFLGEAGDRLVEGVYLLVNYYYLLVDPLNAEGEHLDQDYGEGSPALLPLAVRGGGGADDEEAEVEGEDALFELEVFGRALEVVVDVIYTLDDVLE